MAHPSRPAALIYGNQSYAVEQAAEAWVQRVLGPGPRDFNLQRFDAAELLKPGGGESVAERLDALELAGDSLPLLAERYVVRLDRAELVKVPDRAAQSLQRALEELHVQRVPTPPTAGKIERPLWVRPEDAQPEDAIPAGGVAVPLAQWIARVEAQAAGPPLLVPVPGADGAAFGVVKRGKREAVTLQVFLQAHLKPKFQWQGAPAPGAPAPSAGAGRLFALLERWLEAPPQGLWLVLTARAARESDLPRGLLELLTRHGTVEKFITYDDYAPVEFVQEQARRRALHLDRHAAELLIERAGNDQGHLVRELERLALLFPPQARVTAQELEQAVHASGAGSVFQIAEKLAEKDLPGALAVLEQVLGDGGQEHPLLIGVLARQLRQWREAHALLRQGVAEQELPARLKLHPFVAKRVVAQARAFLPQELEAMQQTLARLDVAAKRQGHLTPVLFRDFVQGICAGRFRQSGTGLQGPLPAQL